MNKFNALSVFCGSSPGNDDAFYTEAFAAGRFLALHGTNIIYGGAKVGLMGAVADGSLSLDGKVTGVIPDFLMNKEIAHEGLSELIVVKSMHERKTIMNDLSDGAIVLPGGFGTMDEMFELLTWGQLGLHKKPIGILNTNGFYDHLITFLDSMVEKNLLRLSNREMLLSHNDIESLYAAMLAYDAPLKAKWIKKEEI
ncbi:MAG: TIGR00730 family Rossman fold protein [Saprospiraceae bacterium]|nr:TIGR00730 family Rossman fold protein [Saprospiraceae bacterium]MBK8670515.1 TIGR00730 family Rossman fold protein [Saprospiraceae bacterium]MBL0101412.1 TIGR00730 family Rossman fold protein [Saprospiraceae bacterium]